MSLLTELNRRNVFRAVLAYAVAGWLLVEVMELLTDAFEAPPWVLKVFIGAVLLGVLPVSIFSWVYEITPGGIRKDSAKEGAAGPGRKLNIAVIIMLLIAIGLVLEQRFSRQDAVSPPAVVEQAAPSEGPPVLAVLPFVSKTSAQDEEVFAAGVHDDLLTQLAQLQSLRVISRTSVLEYKDTAKNIREIGQELGADAILEGGIQVAGTRARINLQLIDARTDEHLWAQSFDRELLPTNIFDVQTDIASAVTTALRIRLTEQDATRINALPTENMAAYRAYLRAMRIRDEPGKYDASGFRQALEEAVSLDPGYARAWAELVGAISFGLFSAETSSDEYAEGVERVEKMLEKIRSLAPNSAEHLAAQTFYTYYVLKNYERAHQLAQQAHQLQPGDARLLELKSWIERRTGDYGAMTESLKLIRGLDPRNPRWTRSLVTALLVDHQYDAAAAEIAGSDHHDYLPQYWAALLRVREHRDFDRLVQEVTDLKTEYEHPAGSRQHLWQAVIANRDFETAETLLSDELDTDAGYGMGAHSMNALSRVINYWFLQQQDLLDQALIEARQRLDEIDMDAEGPSRYRYDLDLGLLAAVQGDRAGAERFIRRWQRSAREDKAEFAVSLHHACRILGIAGAAEAATDCIREGLLEPSFVMPFLEPYLPYYDEIREAPGFDQLLAL